MKNSKSEIEQIRSRLNDLMESKADYEQIYSLSLELDKLIDKYYNISAKSH